MDTGAVRKDEGDFVSIESHLSGALAELDQALAAAARLRDQLALGVLTRTP